MKYSTGRKTRVRYSTAMDWDEYEKKTRRSLVRYSTGRGSPLKHSCGAMMDDQLEDQQVSPEDNSGPVKKINI